MQCDGCGKGQVYALVPLCIKCFEKLKKIGWIKKITVMKK